MIPRDWFAGIAMQSPIEQGMRIDHSNSTLDKIAYKMADAMMEEREKQAKVPQSESMACDVMDCRL